VGQADTKLTELRPEASISAPAELKTSEDTLSAMKQNLDGGEYQAVIDAVPQFNEQVKTLQDAMVAKQTVAAAASQEWTTLNTEVPKSLEAIQARVDSLKPNALPKDVTREELQTAKTELETIKVTWTEATSAASAGDSVAAAEKGRTVAAKAEELKNALGMNEQLASAAPAPPAQSAQ
jgi:hypothetical protein